MWSGLEGAFLGGAIAIVATVIGGFVAVAVATSGVVHPVLATVLFVLLCIWAVWVERGMSFKWREAHGELVRRREAKEERKEQQERDRRPLAQPPIRYNPSSWTGA